MNEVQNQRYYVRLGTFIFWFKNWRLGRIRCKVESWADSFKLEKNITHLSLKPFLPPTNSSYSTKFWMIKFKETKNRELNIHELDNLLGFVKGKSKQIKGMFIKYTQWVSEKGVLINKTNIFTNIFLHLRG